MKRETSQLIRKAWLITNRSGFSLVEVLLASAVFGLLVTALVGAYLYGRESAMLAGNQARAIMLSEEGLEATRNMRDADYANLTDSTPTHGLAISNDHWIFSGTEDNQDIFTREITISSVDTKRKLVTVNITWQQNPQRTGSVSAVTYLTNWIAPAGGGVPPNSCSVYCQALPAGYTDGTCRQNIQQCTQNGETYESGGDPICVTNFPGDPSRDTCCCQP